MAGRKSTRRVIAPKRTPEGDARLVLAIEAQRKRMFQVSAIAACLGHALQDAAAPSTLAPELQNVTDVMIQLLDDAAAGLDPTALNLPARAMLGDSA